MKKNTTMKMMRMALLVAGLVLAMGASALAKTQIVIEYSYPNLFDEVQDDIIEQFKAIEPDIEIKVRTKYQSYEDGTKKIIRAAMTNSLPDVSFQGLSRVRVQIGRASCRERVSSPV